MTLGDPKKIFRDAIVGFLPNLTFTQACVLKLTKDLGCIFFKSEDNSIFASLIKFLRSRQKAYKETYSRGFLLW